MQGHARGYDEGSQFRHGCFVYSQTCWLCIFLLCSSCCWMGLVVCKGDGEVICDVRAVSERDGGMLLLENSEEWSD